MVAYKVARRGKDVYLPEFPGLLVRQTGRDGTSQRDWRGALLGSTTMACGAAAPVASPASWEKKCGRNPSITSPYMVVAS